MSILKPLFAKGQRIQLGPKAGQWTLPTGFMEWDEDIETTAIRETKEETGLEVRILRPIKNLLRMSTYDDPRAAALRAETIVDFSLLEELGQRSPQPVLR